MALEVKIIYVDSRYRTVDSVSDSDFRIELGRNIFLPERCVYHLENCVIPHSWYNIEVGVNDSMYYTINGVNNFIKTTIPSMTKIVATIGPASEQLPELTKVTDAGMRLMRINFSHATYEEADLRTSNLRKYAANKGAKQNLNSIMLDTQGPEIRTGSFKDVKEGILSLNK
jgi:hypothetical protein